MTLSSGKPSLRAQHSRAVFHLLPVSRPALTLAALAMCAAAPVLYAQAVDSSLAISSPASATVVPNIIRFSGTVTDGRGYPITVPIEATFSFYSQPRSAQADAPLWQEKQRISPNEKGAYTVYLGVATAKGLPAAIFNTATAQYVGVKLDGEAELARVPLVSVPYALKAADAQTLGGLPASAFVLAGSQVASLAAAGAASITPNASSVTTTGGTSHYIPMFTGASTIANSEIYDTGTSVGVGGVPNASARLDVKGSMIMRGNMIVSRQGNATSSKGYPSYGFDFFSNVYNSSTKTTANPYFALESEPAGNNTSSPSATFNLRYSATGTEAETGFYINSNGTVHFASGQTFPGAGGGITGVSATSPLTGGGTSGNVTIGLSTSSLETTFNPVYARLAAGNNFTSSATFAGPITGNSGGTMYAIQGNTSSGFGVEGMATGTDGYGIDGYTTGNGGVGVYGNSDGGADSNGNYPIGVLAHALEGFGMKSVVDEPMDNYAAVLGLNGGGSSTYSYLKGFEDVSAGVWGDGTDNNNVSFSIGIVGTAETSYGGYFLNNSVNNPTVYATNENAGGSGLFKTLMATSPQGTCGVGGGSLTCTGQVKSLATTASGSHQVETYAMQSPENWMEDFGTGTLSSGTGVVTLDATFAETVSETADYHVFLTPRGDSKGLYVTNLTPTSFEVHESGAGTASIAFDYRIVAKRRGLETQRLTDVTERFQAEMKASKLVKQAVKK
jgi:hypothetical protein